MFNIDRSYIQQESQEETLQSTIIFIRSKYRNDPSLPKPESHGINAEEYEDYIDKKQELSEWEKTMRRKGPVALGIIFCLPPVAVSFYDRSDTAFYLSFLASIVLTACLYIIFKGICTVRRRATTNDKCDSYTEELLNWHEKKKLEETT